MLIRLRDDMYNSKKSSSDDVVDALALFSGIGRQIFDRCRIRFEQWLIFRIQEISPFLVTYL
uniref:Uncharacterized protein n=1 Tax=Romanomermis culicivorax TaxID=13658 RepID=A0A915JPY7_ROMCU